MKNGEWPMEAEWPQSTVIVTNQDSYHVLMSETASPFITFDYGNFLEINYYLFRLFLKQWY